MRKTQIFAAMTSLAMSCAMLSAPAHAAKFRGTPVLTYQSQDQGIGLGIDGLLRGENVYAVQLTLEVDGAYPNLELIPHESYIQSESKAEVFGQKTVLNVYLDAQAPINDSTELYLGHLNLDRANALPRRAELILLDKDLDRTDTTVSVQKAGESRPEGNRPPADGDSSGEESRPAEAARVEHSGRGRVEVWPARAAVGSTVTVTATPDAGYAVASIAVTDSRGRMVKVTQEKDGRFSFVQPKDGPVRIQVNFQQETVTPSQELPFLDVQKTDWCFDAVSYVYQKGLMAGTSSTTFSPNRTTTRGMIVTILHRMEGKPSAFGEGFQDVPDGQYYSDAVLWAAANGIVNGYGNGNFGPNDTINRAQMAAILYRYAAYKGYDVSARASLEGFQDAGQIGSYAVEAMSWGNACGLINGVGNGLLSPRGSATRAQVAAILMRFADKVVKQ